VKNNLDISIVLWFMASSWPWEELQNEEIQLSKTENAGSQDELSNKVAGMLRTLYRIMGKALNLLFLL
jgi:hypothetical protein